MANEPKPASSFNVEEAHDETTSVQMGVHGGKPVASSQQDDGISHTFERSAEGKPAVKAGEEPAVKEPLAKVEREPAPEPKAGDEPVKDEAAPVAEPLGEWKPDDTATVDAYDKRYFLEDGAGKLNEEVLSKEFWDNKAAGKAGLHEATYNFLSDTLGVSKETVQRLEAGLVAAGDMATAAFYSKVGGKDSYDAAVKWGKEGGYTPEQRTRFNAEIAKGGAAAEDAVLALIASRTQALGTTQEPAGRRRRGPSSPSRTLSDAPAGGEGAAGDGFQTQEAYQKAWSEGLATQKAAKTPDEKRAAVTNLEGLHAKARRSRMK